MGNVCNISWSTIVYNIPYCLTFELMRVNLQEITFSWNTLVKTCSAHYNKISSLVRIRVIMLLSYYVIRSDSLCYFRITN